MKKRLPFCLLSKSAQIIVRQSVGFALLIIVGMSGVMAQAPAYQFSASQGSYTPIVGGTTAYLTPVFANGSVSKTDEGFHNGASIGFTFSYNGVNYNSVNINTNGFVTLGSGFQINSNAYYYINDLAKYPYNFSTSRPVIAPLWDNLDVQADSNITYTTTGITPNRVFTVQWQNVLWDAYAYAPSISFQMQLFEGTNKIVFVYQPLSTLVHSAYGGASIGITSSSTGPGTFISLSDNSASPSTSLVASFDSIGILPKNGQTFEFTPFGLCSGTLNGGTSNASVSSICPNQYFSLSLSGASQASNLKYQWQSLLPGSSWTNLPSDTTIAVPNAYLSAATEYRCAVSCPTQVGSTVYSSQVSVGLNSTSCPPQNDEIIGAISLTHSIYDTLLSGVNFSTQYASASPTPSTFFNPLPQHDLWYSFVATQNKFIIRLSNVTALSGKVGTIAVGFYSGTVKNLKDGYGLSIPINNGIGESQIVSGLTVGATYYLRLATIGSIWIASGDISILHPDIDASYSNTCYATDLLNIDDTNNTGWQTLTNGNKLVADINPNGNNLGALKINLFVNSKSTRKDTKGIFYLNRNVEIDPTVQPATPVTVRFYFKTTELNSLIAQSGSGVTSLANLNATIDYASCGDTLFSNSTLLVPIARGVFNDSIDYVDIQTTLSLTSSFYLHGGNKALPISFSGLKGVTQDGKNQLTWNLLHETNTKDLVIERSIDGVHFSTITTVGKSANSSYISTDNFPIAGTNYYRIKLENADGTILYSETVLVNNSFTDFAVLQLFPNPVMNYLNLNFASPLQAALLITVTDVFGKSVYQTSLRTEVGNNKQTISVSSLTKGTYFVHFNYNNGRTTAVQKFVKQ